MNTTNHPVRIALAVGAISLLVAACGGGSGGTQWTFAPVPSTAPAGSPSSSGPAPSAGGSPQASPASSSADSPPASAPASADASPQASGAAGEVIELVETASVQIVQDGQPVTALTVKSGETYTFRVTNEAGFAHNFYIGPPADLAANNVTGLPGVPDFNEGTQEFQYTVTDETAGLEFACTVDGHYPSMNGTFAVEP